MSRGFFIEIIDIGGHPTYQYCRRILYTKTNGIVVNFIALLLVYDVSNTKSYYNLNGWIKEIEESRNIGDGPTDAIEKWDNYWIPVNVYLKYYE